ncbi:armadillo-like helical domain containing protein 1 [Empidonax traillii]|uniref:armadillo-like helical domain containing protein 1 n=1 Tax=Empidonax traillii TaxID=164674 RepID=UPI000FFD1E8E|nr:armadillo-like helical domain containing protein 1 [Empidonax traillii]
MRLVRDQGWEEGPCSLAETVPSSDLHLLQQGDGSQEHGLLAEEDGLQGRRDFWLCSPYPGSHTYLTEFLEIGGVSIPLEILGLNHLKVEDKRESVKLLLLAADTGVPDLAKFLASSNKAVGQDDTQILLDSSGCGNPKYQSQVYLVAVLLCTSTGPAWALPMLRVVQHMVGEVPCALEEPVLGVLRSVHLEVQ